MKKFVSLLLVYFMLLPITFAQDVTGNGIGSTEEEALRFAREDVISRFSINVSSLTYTADTDDGASNTSSSMSSYSLQSTSFNLLGSVEDVKQGKDGYVATCTIPETSAPLYEAQLNNLYSTINALNNQVERGDAPRSTYLRLITALRDYELYQTVVLTLNPSSSVAMRSLPTTRSVIENEYQAMLIRENNNTQITVTNLQQQSEMGILSLEGRSELNAALAALEENRRQQEELNILAQSDYELQREAFQQEMAATAQMLHENLSSYFTAEAAGGEMNYAQLINQIEANRATLQAIKDTLNDSLGSIMDSYDEEVKRSREEILHSPYSQDELYNGQPTMSAVNYRNQRADEAEKEIRERYSAQADLIYKEAFDRMSALTDYTLSYVDELNGKTFRVNSFDPEVSAAVDRFVENAGLFSGIATITIGNSSIDLIFRIPYEAWTGEKAASSSDFAAFTQYRDTGNDWLDIFTKFPEIFTIEFTFTVNNDLSSEYEITFESYTITRNDTGEEVFSDSISQNDTLRYPSRTSLTDFTVSNGELVDYGKYVYSREKVDLGITVSDEVEKEETAESSASEVKEEKGRSRTPLKSFMDDELMIEVYGNGLWNSTGFDTMSIGLKFVPTTRTFTYGFDAEWLFRLDQPATVSKGYIGVGLNTFFPVASFMNIYVDASVGVGSWFGEGIDLAESVFFGAVGRAGFYFDLGSLFALDVGGTVSWMDSTLYYGAHLGVVFHI